MRVPATVTLFASGMLDEAAQEADEEEEEEAALVNLAATESSKMARV